MQNVSAATGILGCMEVRMHSNSYFALRTSPTTLGREFSALRLGAYLPCAGAGECSA